MILTGRLIKKANTSLLSDLNTNQKAKHHSQKRIKKELEKYESEKDETLVYIGNQLKKARSLYNENKLKEVIPVYEKILTVNPSNKFIRSKKANIKIEIETIEK